jgi:hypothetical protein
MPLHYQHLIEALLIDLSAMAFVAFGVFYRRHRRADLMFAYVALNIGLFTAGVMIVAQMRVGVAFGFGLFAILSIIRLRSEPIAPEEAAYYFVSLILGLVNGVEYRDQPLVITLTIAVVAVVALLDNGFVLPRSRRQLVTLDVVHPTETALVADLERRLGGKMTRVIVKQVDYVRDTTIVDVRYSAPVQRRRARARAESALTEVTSR